MEQLIQQLNPLLPSQAGLGGRILHFWRGWRQRLRRL